jgi:lysozyme
MIDSGPALTKDHEGYSPIYLDSMGYPTQGYGSLLKKKSYKTLREYHEELFQEQYDQAVKEYETIGLSLDAVRTAAAVDMCYNLGLKGLLGFNHFLAAIKMRDWLSAAASLENSLWYKQVGRRGPRITKLIREGRWDVL